MCHRGRRPQLETSGGLKLRELQCLVLASQESGEDRAERAQ